MMDWMQYLNAFWVGGLICVVAQLLIDLTRITPARILTTYVCAGVVLSAFGLYGPLKDFAGSGAAVPLTGFGHALAEGVRESVATDGLLGALSGGLQAAATGISASLFFALIWSLLFKSRQK